MNTQPVRILTLALAAALAAGCATTPRVQPEVLQLQNELQRLRDDPRIAPYAVDELRDAEVAVAFLAANARDMRPSSLDQSLYIANRLVQIAEAEGLAGHASQLGHALDREREQLLVDARRRDATIARRQAEQAQLSAERERLLSEQARRQAAQERQLGREAMRAAELERLRSAEARERAEQERLAAERARMEAEQARAEAMQARRALNAMQVELAEMQAKQTERGLVITIGDVLFETGSAELKPGARRQLDKLVAALRDNPDFSVAIEGHTDSTGSRQLNERLSQRRADAVRGYLAANGIDSDRLRAIGLGPDYPVAANTHPAGRQQNRRVEVVIQDPNIARLGAFERE